MKTALSVGGLYQVGEVQEGISAAEDRMTGPGMKAGIATRTMTNSTLVQVIRAEISFSD